MKTVKLISFVLMIDVFACCSGLPKNKPVHVIPNYRDTNAIRDDTNSVVTPNYTDIPRDTVYTDTDGVISKIHYAEGNFCTEDGGDKVRIKFFYEDYYPNGVLKEKGIQGYGEEGGALVGTTYQYDSLGKLVATVQHHTAPFEKAFLLLTEYYGNGVAKSIKKYKNYDEFEIDEQPIGLWKFYDTTGVLIKTELYNNEGELMKTEHYSKNK